MVFAWRGRVAPDRASHWAPMTHPQRVRLDLHPPCAPRARRLRVPKNDTNIFLGERLCPPSARSPLVEFFEALWREIGFMAICADLHDISELELLPRDRHRKDVIDLGQLSSATIDASANLRLHPHHPETHSRPRRPVAVQPTR